MKTSLFHFSEGCLHIPNFFIWSSVMQDRQVKWWFCCVHFHWSVTAEFFVKTDRTSRCISGINLWLECSLVSSLLTMWGLCASLDQTKTSWPSFCCWSWTSPQPNLRLSSLARKPKCRDKNHHTVLWSATRLESPNSPALKKASS